MASSPDFGTPNPQKILWRFAECEFDELRFQLTVHGQPVELERKPLELLRYLLAHSGEVVRKEELLDAVWPGVIVVDASLATAVSKLRKVLGDQEIVQTVPRVGYRIAVPVLRLFPPNSSTEFVADVPVALAPDTPAAPPQRPPALFGRRLLWAGGAIAAILLISIGLIGSRSRKPATSPQPASVAILPFQNVSGNQSLDYLRSALPDEIAQTFASAKSLNMRPLAASARFTGPAVDFKRLGRDLDVNRAITGHYLIMGDRLHVTMEAVDTDQNRIVWQDNFEVPSNNLLAMQEQIATISHGKLAEILGVPGFSSDASPRTSNEAAYELYLKSLAVKWDNQTDRQAIEFLRQAVLLDPNYAPAWEMLALRYYGASRFGGGGPEMMALSDAALDKELALNPDSLDPIAEMTIHRTERGDIVKAHQIALELVRRKPDDPNLHHVLSYVLRYGGSLDEAGRECEITVLLATKVVWGSCSTTFRELGNYDRARFFVRKDLSSEWSKSAAIELLLRQGNKPEALRIPAPQIPHWDSYKMLLACARGAPPEEIKALSAKVEVDDDPEINYLFAGHLAYCGQTEAALRMLKIAIDRHYCSFPTVDKDPFFDRLRNNPQFQKLRSAAMACHADFVNPRGQEFMASDSHTSKETRLNGSD
ncbi:winged helix-turn-helix domain-containing protein [Occallatibacter savannae]|uniref:winged helix-turn-helix domain-containing protein n=1 Tax=Occallatibacter savannae TaxID=1002691 RepID=UPI000D693D50|nr:winged helix-turn-helix domain-containing protein [Occallatibacter savannae]